MFFAVEEPSVAMNVDGVGALPQSSPPASGEHHLLDVILALLCGVLCKNPSLDEVPVPTQDMALNNPYPGRCLVNFVRCHILCSE